MNSLTQSLMACPQQVQALKCCCCGQFHGNHQEVVNTIIMAEIFGVKKYAVCPDCLQIVDGPPWNNAYKQRWTRRVKKLIKKEKYDGA